MNSSGLVQLRHSHEVVRGKGKEGEKRWMIFLIFSKRGREGERERERKRVTLEKEWREEAGHDSGTRLVTLLTWYVGQ
jgi:hypothetical protein